MSPLQGRDILKGLEELPSRNVSVRALASIPSVKTNSTDLQVLRQKGLFIAPLSFLFLHLIISVYLLHTVHFHYNVKIIIYDFVLSWFGGIWRVFPHDLCTTELCLLSEGVHVRRVNFGHLTRGILHSKFWIVDSKHVFIGSANMDWRALTQVYFYINILL